MRACVRGGMRACVHVMTMTSFLQAAAGLHGAHVVPVDVDQVGPVHTFQRISLEFRCTSALTAK